MRRGARGGGAGEGGGGRPPPAPSFLRTEQRSARGAGGVLILVGATPPLAPDCKTGLRIRFVPAPCVAGAQLGGQPPTPSSPFPRRGRCAPPRGWCRRRAAPRPGGDRSSRSGRAPPPPRRPPMAVAAPRRSSAAWT